MIMKTHQSTLLPDRSIENRMASKPTTLKIMAELLGVSATTVSRSLIDHPSISSITKIKVKELALKMDYRPSRKALAFRNGRSYTIGIIVLTLENISFLRQLQRSRMLQSRMTTWSLLHNRTIMRKKKSSW